MNKLALLCILFPLFAFSQDYKMDDMTGEWKISKCEMYISNKLYKSAIVNESFEKVFEGRNVGEFDNIINNVMKTIIGTGITFNSDSTVTWDAEIYKNNLVVCWQLVEPGLLIFYEYKNRLALRPLLLVCKIITLQPGMLYVKAFEWGAELRIVLNK
jgi:hypothetical protein